MNETPENQKVLLAVAKKIRAGAATLQDTIGLHHHRDTTLNTAILKLEGDPAAAPGSNANKGSQLVYKSCEDAAKDARSALKALSDGTVKTLLTAYRDVLERIHGKKHNAGWSAAGFTDGVSVPVSTTSARACWRRCAPTWPPMRATRSACLSPAAAAGGDCRRRAGARH
jgi:hypothetical protein